MARRHRNTPSHPTRTPPRVANRRLLGTNDGEPFDTPWIVEERPSGLRPSRVIRSPLHTVEDHRLFKIDPVPRTITGRKASIHRPKHKLPKLGRMSPWDKGPAQRARFKHPLHVVICVQRKIRREVMIAKKLKGKGGGSPRLLKPYSFVRC